MEDNKTEELLKKSKADLIDANKELVFQNNEKEKQIWIGHIRMILAKINDRYE